MALFSSGCGSSFENFDTSLRTSQGVGLDIMLYNEDGTLDEFVDIIKAPGALRVEIATEDPRLTKAPGGVCETVCVQRELFGNR